MTRTEFLLKVQEQLGFADMIEAETATRSVLAALASRLTPEEVDDLANQLPSEFGDFIRGRGGEMRGVDAEAFVGRIQSDLDIATSQQAMNVTRGVFSVIKQAVSESEWQEVASQLPTELQDLFVRA